MKRPEKMSLDNLTFGHNLSGDARQMNGRVWGAWQMWGEWEKYHSWYVKEKYAKKEDLPSEEEIKDVIIKKAVGLYATIGYIVDGEKLARAISKLIRGQK